MDSYDGIVIAVSHDRYFLDRVVRRIFAFEGDGEIRQYEGGYTDYRNRLEEEGRQMPGMSQSAAAETGTQTSTVPDSKATWTSGKKLKFSYKEQREYETIEDDIAALEQKVEDLDNEMAANATNAAKLRELMEEKEKTEAALEEKMERWEYLEELAAKIAGNGR